MPARSPCSSVHCYFFGQPVDILIEQMSEQACADFTGQAECFWTAGCRHPNRQLALDRTGEDSHLDIGPVAIAAPNLPTAPDPPHASVPPPPHPFTISTV